MAKKFISIILIFIFLVTFCGCKSKTQIEKAQEKIVSIGERFLDYELTIDEAVEQLENIFIPSTDGSGSLIFSVDKDYLMYLILKTKSNSDNFDKIKETIQDIKQKDYTIIK